MGVPGGGERMNTWAFRLTFSSRCRRLVGNPYRRGISSGCDEAFVMFRTLLVVSLALVLALGVATKARAEFITPVGLGPGDQFRVVFLTHTVTDATSGSLSYYDGIVSGEAALAGLATYNGVPVTWEAIISTANTSAISRLPADSVPIYLPDGTLVTTGGAALWNSGVTNLANPINEDAFGTVIGSAAFGPDVWTGTTIYGTYAPSGGLGDSAPSYGYVNVGTAWIDNASGPPTNLFPEYGFSSVLTVPETTAVPEPGTFTLALVGIGGLLGSVLARRR
jgi:PEP-CTERM motif